MLAGVKSTVLPVSARLVDSAPVRTFPLKRFGYNRDS
jgi:hypothetical protein